MATENIPFEKRRVYTMFSAVFSQKPAVSAKRIIIIDAIDKCTKGKMKFRDILREIQSETGGVNYSSEKLTYDIRVLKKNGLINKTRDGEYTVTENGNSLLDMYHDMERRSCSPENRPKIGFKSEVNGRIKAAEFDFNVLGDELTRLPLFRKKFGTSKKKACLELKDDNEDFASTIDIRENGEFSIIVILYRNNQPGEKGFLSEFDQSEEWYENACAIASMVTYYIKRTARKLWKDSKVKAPKPDAYPV